VPFIIKWPGVTKAGSTCDKLVSQIDFMGTIASLLGYKLPDNAAEDSHDLLPLLHGRKKTSRTVHVHNTRAEAWAIRVGEWNLIAGKSGYHSGRVKAWEEKRNYPVDDDDPVELYNYAKDISQRNNLAKKFPKKVAELHKELQVARERGFTAPRLIVSQ
jgi:arylsulfatase A